MGGVSASSDPPRELRIAWGSGWSSAESNRDPACALPGPVPWSCELRPGARVRHSCLNPSEGGLGRVGRVQF
jgi:hypothetical protein